jgi:hypothetical protein
MLNSQFRAKTIKITEMVKTLIGLNLHAESKGTEKIGAENQT